MRGLRTVAVFAALGFAPAARPADAAKLEFFEKKVRPILVENCYGCHSADTKPAGGLRVDDITGLKAGGNTGPAVVPGDPAKSLLLTRVAHGSRRQMPIEGRPLTADEVAVLTAWVKDGAAWPAVKVPASVGKADADYAELRKSHWAFKPLADSKPPAVKDAAWPRSDIDRWVLAGLEAKSLKPGGDADRRTLIRRVTFDLTGLPPTPAEVEAFLKDNTPDAFAKLIDRLLGSPAFGEKWGRHWLDVARYGESSGPSRNIPYPHAWRYRDYVIDAVNADVPFDRFIREQVAGDLLPSNTPAERDRLTAATGFLALGVKDVNQRFKVRFVMDNVDEQIDAVTRSVVGLTASCARCHDHKFDPIPQADYYALAGIFVSTDNAAGVRNKMGGGGLDYYDPAMLMGLATPAPPVDDSNIGKLKEELAAAKKAWDNIRGTPEGLRPGPNGQPTQRPFRLKFEALQAQVNALGDPKSRGHAAHGARDAKEVGDTELRVRGEAEKLGPKVPRGFLTAFAVPGAAKIDAAKSGRLELADWLVNPKNPLTSRVFANRVWGKLFGEGLVSTVDNFGVTGDTPSHPELLDALAAKLVRDGWSLKRLVREIVLSRAYQLDSAELPGATTIDPANRLIWRHAPRRLDAEEVRDAMLASSGELDPKRPQGSPVSALKMVEIRDNGPEAAGLRSAADASRSRSVYLPAARGITPAALEAFDPVEQTLVTGKRDSTTVPAQALFVLNSNFVRQRALALAKKLSRGPGDDSAVAELYRAALQREPDAAEVKRALGFVAHYEASAKDQPYKTAEAPKPAPKVVPKTDTIPANADDLDQTPVQVAEQDAKPADAKEAAWAALVQAVLAAAEFRYVR